MCSFQILFPHLIKESQVAVVSQHLKQIHLQRNFFLDCPTEFRKYLIFWQSWITKSTNIESFIVGPWCPLGCECLAGEAEQTLAFERQYFTNISQTCPSSTFSFLYIGPKLILSFCLKSFFVASPKCPTDGSES